MDEKLLFMLYYVFYFKRRINVFTDDDKENMQKKYKDK